MDTMKREALATIKASQLRWARDAGVACDFRGYCTSVEENVRWMTDDMRQAFSAADGNELSGPRAKMSALHSSSALGANFFGYWSTRDKGTLAINLGIHGPIDEIAFERKFATGVGPRSPNLDIVLSTRHGIVGIESKFSETFSASSKGEISDRYFAGRERWTERGLPGAQRVAERVKQGLKFRFLDAPQLLKHMLGLGGCGTRWALFLVWYAPTSEAEMAMTAESEEFRELLGEDRDRFRALTYQTLWRSIIERLPSGHGEYRTYMTSRYFPSVSALPDPRGAAERLQVLDRLKEAAEVMRRAKVRDASSGS